jgi:hypothetical protein
LSVQSIRLSISFVKLFLFSGFEGGSLTRAALPKARFLHLTFWEALLANREAGAFAQRVATFF